MRPLIEQAQKQLRDVSNSGILSIEKQMVIDRLVTKMDGIESEELIVAKINGLVQKHGRDIEALNSDTDLVIRSLLKQLGYNKLAMLLESLPSW